jgi:hypothetical protein
MELPSQKNFYDVKRQFQGKDNPGAPHPDSRVKAPAPVGQMLFGLLFLVAIAAMAYANVRGASRSPPEGKTAAAESE